MSVPGPTVRAILLAVAIVAVSACGSAVPPAGGGATPASATQNPAVTPGTQSTPDAPVPGASTPPIADGAWTSGKWHVEISGGVSATLDAPLQGGFNFTDAGTTILSYADPTTGDGGAVQINSEGYAITLSSPVSTLGISFISPTGSGCTVTMTQTDASRLAGSFDCKQLPGVVPSTSKRVAVNLKGTFEAAR